MQRRLGDARKIASERIEELFNEARKSFKSHPGRSHKYVRIALKISAKAGIKISREFRSNYCRKCKRYLESGVNARIRTRKGKVVISCFNCGNHRRIIIKT